MWERNINVREKHQSVAAYTHIMGTRPTTQVCALTRNQTCDLQFCGAMPNQLSHTSQSYICFFFFLTFYCCSSKIVSIFPPPLPQPQSSHFPPLILPLFGFVLYRFFWKSFPPFHPIIPSHLLSSTVNLFLISMSLVIFYLLVCFVPLKGEIIRYLSLTAWLISLSIMLSRSIHAVAKGRSSFVLSAT